MQIMNFKVLSWPNKKKYNYMMKAKMAILLTKSWTNTTKTLDGEVGKIKNSYHVSYKLKDMLISWKLSSKSRTMK